MSPPPLLKIHQCLFPNIFLGGSFGVVYKGIEKATGETVAIKHVSAPGCPAHHNL